MNKKRHNRKTRKRWKMFYRKYPNGLFSVFEQMVEISVSGLSILNDPNVTIVKK